MTASSRIEVGDWLQLLGGCWWVCVPLFLILWLRLLSILIENATGPRREVRPPFVHPLQSSTKLSEELVEQHGTQVEHYEEDVPSKHYSTLCA